MHSYFIADVLLNSPMTVSGTPNVLSICGTKGNRSVMWIVTLNTASVAMATGRRGSGVASTGTMERAFLTRCQHVRGGVSGGTVIVAYAVDEREKIPMIFVEIKNDSRYDFEWFDDT